MNLNAKQVEYLIQQLNVLVVEDNAFMRNIVRGLLSNLGVKKIYEASDGIAGLEMIREVSPDVVVLDWEMPMLSGPDLVRIVRSPGVVEAARLGVNEFLCKPVSAKGLQERLISILIKPRVSVRVGEYYGPVPRSPMLKKDLAGFDELPAEIHTV